ncbi:cupin domain-containing protein [Ferruginibacter albus]|uniref:cupin domain-containing protein n=1 Tax=Ferruginibacter albus TaxID=2875540 RepID=UPI001CC703E3|nr:cupin domain-containing protein [Ferruginibacter albus]UAY53197.1 cupin [Ferruginibacter albus]
MKNTRTNTNPHIIEWHLEKNGNFPNSDLPVLIYKDVFKLPRGKDNASEIIQAIFLRNGWSNTWRNGIYDFHHYHSNAHEALGISSGSANVILGGPNGKRLTVEKGDLLILPAGTGHKCTKHSADFVCIGAYPQGKNYDINHGTAEELKKALPRIEDLSLPKQDPVFGLEGFLKSYWKKLS